MAEHFGIEVRSVMVHRDGSGGYVDRGCFRDPDGAYRDAFPVMMCAGMAAEELYWGDPDTAWEHGTWDRVNLRRFGYSDLDLLGFAGEARAILEAQRPAWQRLAHVLGGGGEFSGGMVRSVLSGGRVDGRMALAALEQRSVLA